MPPTSQDWLQPPNPCRGEFDSISNKQTEYDKVVSAAATTIASIMILLVSVLGLPTANVLELYLMDKWPAAVITAGFTFGLPLSQQSSFFMIDSTGLDGRNLQQHRRLSRIYYPTGPYSLLFFVGQAVLLIVLLLLVHFAVPTTFELLWACSSTGVILWHVLVLSTMPVVGALWILGLSCIYIRDKPEKDGRLRFYRRRFRKPWVQPFIELLPGLARALVTIFFIFMFTSFYSTSMFAALLYVLFFALFLYSSRALSILYARSVAAPGDPPKNHVLFRYNDEEDTDRWEAGIWFDQEAEPQETELQETELQETELQETEPQGPTQ